MEEEKQTNAYFEYVCIYVPEDSCSLCCRTNVVAGAVRADRHDSWSLLHEQSSGRVFGATRPTNRNNMVQTRGAQGGGGLNWHKNASTD